MKKKLSSIQKALNLWAIILIVWSIYRAKFRFPEWIDEFIAKPIVFILPVYYFISKIEKKDFLKDIDLKSKKFFQDIIFGLAIGGIFYLTALLAFYFKFKQFNIFPEKSVSIQTLLFFLTISLATGISEEILSRGFILKRLYKESGNMISSSFFASILFFFLHIPILFTNLKISGNLLLFFMATDLILSLTLSFIFLERKSLTLAILIHAFYNFSLIVFI